MEMRTGQPKNNYCMLVVKSWNTGCVFCEETFGKSDALNTGFI